MSYKIKFVPKSSKKKRTKSKCSSKSTFYLKSKISSSINKELENDLICQRIKADNVNSNNEARFPTLF